MAVYSGPRSELPRLWSISVFLLLPACIAYLVILNRIDFRVLLGAFGIIVLLLLSFVLPTLSLFVSVFAGRSDLPPLVFGYLDITFWSTMGLGLFCLILLSNAEIRRRTTLLHPIILTHITFFILVGIMWTPTFQYEYATDKTLRTLVFGTAAVVLPQFVLTSKEKLISFLRLSIILVTVLAAISVALSLSDGLGGWQRISLPGGGPITLARMTGFAAIAAIGLALIGRERRPYFSCAVFLVIVTFGSGSRGPALFLVGALFVILIGMLLNGATRRGAGPLLIFCIFGSGLVYGLVNVAVKQGLPFAKRYLLLFASDRGASVNARTSYLQEALSFVSFRDLAGHGTGSWPILIGLEDRMAYPHNILAEILVEQGTLGLLLFSLAIVTVAVSVAKCFITAGDRDFAILCIIGASSYSFALMNAQVSGDLFDNRFLWFFAGFIVSCANLSKWSSPLVAEPSVNSGLCINDVRESKT